jgi:hypothetical protein
MSYSKKHTEAYVKAILDIVMAIADEPDLNKRLLIIAAHGQIAQTMNDLMAASVFAENRAEIDRAVELVNEGLDIMMTTDDDSPILFTGYSDDSKPKA